MAAYAWYHGVQIETVLDLIRKAGVQAVLLRELAAHKARDRKNDAQIADARLPDDQQARLDEVWEQVDGAGKRVIQKSADIDAVLNQAGKRDLNVLAAMSQWRSGNQVEPALARCMSKRAAEFLRRSFASAMYDPEGKGPDVGFSERIINPLIEALKHDGIPVDLFRSLHERLASDAFSRMTRYATWINDRKRAVALLLIAGMVARERSDDTLLEAVKQAAAELLSQPEGFHRILTPESAQRVEDRFGFPIPLA